MRFLRLRHSLQPTRHFEISAFSTFSTPRCPRPSHPLAPTEGFFGDTINTASRMESTGSPMCIHCSESTYVEYATHHRARVPIEFASYGERYVKGKGRMSTRVGPAQPRPPSRPPVGAATRRSQRTLSLLRGRFAAHIPLAVVCCDVLQWLPPKHCTRPL